ncbi:probable WRKY transcription factor protein 1 isoform X2 [Octopus bimaculoides]|uniref:CCDC66 domain-containing protein n=2 Tax=Octopus bimaculoides TaxID=37653 RepID=A0A0L8FTB0_OCTBM|nr:probable WRKY transcription factor protein 1 isoform X2 [Octopus bimaculoides]|eukprot:XP_014787090.1 PREDICTED: uncharacterized protein LOC106881276 isoform X2 [Octopus bimaculoides]
MPLNHKQNSHSAMTVVANQPMKDNKKRLQSLANQANTQKTVQKKKNHSQKSSNGNLKSEHPYAESIIVSQSQLKEILKSVGKIPSSTVVPKNNQSQNLPRSTDEISKKPSKTDQQKQSPNKEMYIHHEVQAKFSRPDYSPKNFVKSEPVLAKPNKDQQSTQCAEKPVLLTLAERKKQQWLKEKAEQITPYDPWGRPGAGAPKVNPKGQIITSYKNTTVQSYDLEDNLNRIEMPSEKSGQQAGFDEKITGERSEATTTATTTTTTTTTTNNEGVATNPGDNRRKMSQQPLPAAMRDNLFIGQKDGQNYEDSQRREQLNSLEELDQKKEEKSPRILHEAGKHQQAESSRIESPPESSRIHKSHLRGALTIHTDPITQQQLEEKKRKNQELMLELKAQIDEQKKAKELQWKQKQLEDAEAERKMLEEQKILQKLHETEIQLEKKKKEAQEIHFQQLAANIELAREAAIKEKKLKRLQHLEKNGHDTRQLKKDFERNFNTSSSHSNYEIDQFASGTSISEDKHTPKKLPKSTAEQFPESQFQKVSLNGVSQTGNFPISSQSNYDSNQLLLGTTISEHKQSPKILMKTVSAQLPETQSQKVYLNCASQTDGIYGGDKKSLYHLINGESGYLYDDDDDDDEVFIATAAADVGETKKKFPSELKLDNHNEMMRTIKPTNKRRQGLQSITGSKPTKSSNQLPLLQRKSKKNITSRKLQTPTWETDGSNDQLVDYNTSNILRQSCSESHDPVTIKAGDEFNGPPSPRVSRLRNKRTQPPPSRTTKTETTTKPTARTKSTTSPLKSVFQKKAPVRFSRHHSSPPMPTSNRKLQTNKQNTKTNSNVEVNKYNYDDYKRVPQQPQPLLKAKKYSDNSPLQGPVKEGDFIPFTRTSEVLDPAGALSPLPISREQSAVLRGRDRYRKGNDPANCGSPAPHFTDNSSDLLERSSNMQDLQDRKPVDQLSSTAAQEAFLKELSALRKKLKQMELESSTVLLKTTYQSSLNNR